MPHALRSKSLCSAWEFQVLWQAILAECCKNFPSWQHSLCKPGTGAHVSCHTWQT